MMDVDTDAFGCEGEESQRIAICPLLRGPNRPNGQRTSAARLLYHFSGLFLGDAGHGSGQGDQDTLRAC